MINRYRSRNIVKNNMNLYSETFRNRNVKYIYQYTTPNFSYINPENFDQLNYSTHIWKEGDRFYKLAEKYYGDAQDWWVIARFNLKPTESHVQLGEELLIPFPLQKVLDYLRG